MSAMSTTDIEPGGWQAWHGGDRPVSLEAWVDVKLRGGAFLRNCVAGALYWHALGIGNDIVAYRLSPTFTVEAERGVNQCVTEPDIPDERDLDPRLNEVIKHIIPSVAARMLREAFERAVKDFQKRCQAEAVRFDDAPDSRDYRANLGSGAGSPTNSGAEPLNIPIRDGSETNPEKESAPEIQPVWKAGVESDFERARHITSLWDNADSVVLDGFAYRTDGIDHVRRRATPPPSPRKI